MAYPGWTAAPEPDAELGPPPNEADEEAPSTTPDQPSDAKLGGDDEKDDEFDEHGTLGEEFLEDEDEGDWDDDDSSDTDGDSAADTDSDARAEADTEDDWESDPS